VGQAAGPAALQDGGLWSGQEDQEEGNAVAVTNEVTDLAAKFQQAFGELTIPDVSRDSLREQLANAAGPLGVMHYGGTIAAVGESAPGGNYLVQFNDAITNSAYYSAWPQWAYGLAQAALLADKDVMLVANGLPFGSNLIAMLIAS
jgi:hypothetical protein